MAITAPTSIAAERVQVLLVRNNKIIYDSLADEKKPLLTFDPNLLKFCPDCGGPTAPIIYVCKDCGKRYVTQLDTTSGKRLIVALSAVVEDESSKGL